MDMNFKWTTRAEKLLVVEYWWKEQGGRCCLCSLRMKPYSRQHSTDPDAATVEHVIPRRENGPNTAGNVRLAHARCNHALGALWEQNRQLTKRGKPAQSVKWAINSAAGNQRARERLQAEKARNEGCFVNPRAVNHLISLPRGATLLPIYGGNRKRKPQQTPGA